jgi:hypothetical protein
MTEEVKKNSKFLKHVNVDIDNENHVDYEEDSDNEINDIIERDYYTDVVITVQKTLINYVEKNSVPMCEYLSVNKIDSFLGKIFEM